MRRWLHAVTLVLLAQSAGWAAAVEIKGVSVPETARIETVDQVLSLNGAGIRKKFFVSVYIGALYLVEKSTSADAIIAADQPRRIAMHFLYDKVEAAKLQEAWLEGFQANMKAEEFERVKPRLEKFNGYFGDAVKGDVIHLDYIPGVGTRVLVNSEVKGTIPGADFSRGLISVWLGSQPVTEGLKEAMLGK
ncbi:MAG: hypothetical protein DWQ09_12480 [Proteobacteria bacterium]|nr:MAG: hypothetical protein DWQ09_12480 [Pseudomonadota bacterium]